ncbi:MAG: sugar phosphorylase [bacterium]|nr:sugar phosphorylase [bacterium]
MSNVTVKKEEILQLLDTLYGQEKSGFAYRRLMELVNKYRTGGDHREEHETPLFSEKDIVLITYGDSLKRDSEPPLTTLHRFARDYLKDIVSTIHILPCFPYSSDDGFSVIDYLQIDPGLGTWQEVRELGNDFKLMLDLVLNHLSAQSPWMKKYLAGEPGFSDLAVEVDPSTDLSQVTRPRALPLLTPFEKDNGERVHLWTTFSADQVDVNFKSVDVMLKMAEVLMRYAKEGASIVRLDAIAYLWKETGTTCIHLPQTHTAVKLLRQIFNAVRNDAIILTETNVPHAENISYFGNGYDEARMVYNFTLPPLLLYSFVSEDARVLTKWAGTLAAPSEETTFFNFTASHDGIGVRPLEGIIPPPELEKIVETVKANNGRVSYKQNSDGSQSPYELNVTYVDAYWRNNDDGNDPMHIPRFLASQAIQLALPGVPAVYIHSLLGSRNWNEGVAQTGRARTINREKLAVDSVIEELADPNSFRHRVFSGYSRLLKVRRSQSAFHPNASFRVLDILPGLFSTIRRSETQTIYTFTNVTSRPVAFSCGEHDIPPGLTDLLTGKQITGDRTELAPYETLWLDSHPGR